MSTLCPCQSGKQYQYCCYPIHQGTAAVTPEQLMRSRYSAFSLGLAAYLEFSLASEFRTPNLKQELETNFAPHMIWVGLKIHSAIEQKVHFSAYFIADSQLCELEEISDFEKQQGHWKYTSGELINHDPQTLSRNQPCPCGSGKKFKQCCFKKMK